LSYDGSVPEACLQREGESWYSTAPRPTWPWPATTSGASNPTCPS